MSLIYNFELNAEKFYEECQHNEKFKRNKIREFPIEKFASM
jgi:hypothetical protein